MPKLSEMLENLTWKDEDLGDLRQHLAGAELDDELLREVFLDAGLATNTQPEPIDPCEAVPRFLRRPAPAHAEAAAAAAVRFSHPYVTAVLYDYAAEATARSVRWRDLGMLAATRYVDAVQRFAAGNLGDHLIGVLDAVIRSRTWLSRFSGNLDPLTDAVLSVTRGLSGTPLAPFIGPLAKGLSIGAPSKSSSRDKLADLYRQMQVAIEGIGDLGRRAMCALDIKSLSRSAGESVAHDDWSTGIIVDSAWVRLPCGSRISHDLDHLTLRSRGLGRGSGSGISPST